MEKIIGIPSVTDHSNETLVKFLIPLAKKSGLKIKMQVVKESSGEFINLLAYSHSLDSKDLLALNTHLDTVPVTRNEDWSSTGGNPFKLQSRGDKLYGLGTADVKLDFLCKLWGAAQSRPWKRPFVLVGTYGEERGLVGVKKLFEEKLISPTYAVVGEPSRLQIIYAHKGHVFGEFWVPQSDRGKKGEFFEKQWKGKACHSSTPDLGKNAVHQALEEIAKKSWGIFSIEGGTAFNIIPDRCQAKLFSPTDTESARVGRLYEALSEMRKCFQKKSDSRFDPSKNTLSINKISTSRGGISLTFDMRLLPATDPTVVNQELLKAAKKAGCQLRRFEFDPPLDGSAKGILVKECSKALKASGVPVLCKTKATSTEAAVYHANGASAIVFGPGISEGNVHRPNEYNLLSHVKKASLFYQNLLLREF